MTEPLNRRPVPFRDGSFSQNLSGKSGRENIVSLRVHMKLAQGRSLWTDGLQPATECRHREAWLSRRSTG